MSESISKKMSFDAVEIQRMLPHRYPFLLLDKAFDIDPGKSGNGTKLYTINEWFFQGHFPGEPIVPGVLLIESLAQLTAVIYLSEALDKSDSQDKTNFDLTRLAGKVGYLVKANVKFMSPVRPGNTLEMSAAIIKKMGSLSLVNVKAMVGRNQVISGELSVSEREEF